MARLAPSLVRARAIIDARWPDRDRTSDGWIGDPAHQARQSDHNPNVRGVVDAIDVDMFGGPSPVIRGVIVAAGIMHPAINYVIFNRRIYQASDSFRPRYYDGINPHDRHCHYSIHQSVAAENSNYPWSLLATWPTWGLLGRELASSGNSVDELQAFLNAWGASLVVDGDFGPATDTAVRNLQRTHGLAVDGLVGPITRSLLFS